MAGLSAPSLNVDSLEFAVACLMAQWPTATVKGAATEKWFIFLPWGVFFFWSNTLYGDSALSALMSKIANS